MDKKELIVVFGRGHSGTRTLAHTLLASGIYMGQTINSYGDLVPADGIYEACQLIAPYVQTIGERSWNFRGLHKMIIPRQFKDLVNEYLRFVLLRDAGFKLPEITLIFPWFVRMFPDAKYIHIKRQPGDTIAAQHLTDDLTRFGIDAPETDDVLLRRAISYKYQADIVNDTPKPQNFLEVNFEDFVLEQEKTLAILEDYLKRPLARIVMHKENVRNTKHSFEFLKPYERQAVVKKVRLARKK